MAWDWRGKGAVEERFFDLTLLPQRQGVGKPDAVIVFAIDITESVRARKVVEIARREAEVANRAKDEFLATVSHELRTPLNAILGWTSSARRGIVRDLDRALATVERSARAQARIIDDVLDVSRIASGKLRLNIAPTDLRQALFGAVDAVRPAAEARGIALEIAVDDRLGMIAADADRLQQVVWNLLSNAVKFTPPGGRVSFEATRKGGSIVLSVTDTGEGISPEFLPHVFEPFRQADGSTTRRHQGLGLGLAIVKQLVVAHGGIIQAKSDGLGMGATFVAELPARTAPAFRPASAHNGTAGVASIVAAARLDDVRVLLVDDEDDTRALAREVLAGQGAIVEEASSAEEALRKIGSFRPDVMVTDIGMPYADGFSLINHVRRLPPESGGQTPAIALTAYALAEDRNRALAAGFQLHVPKPVDPLELVARIADLGSRKRVAPS
jgi:signal transduction histidine kinase/CheY-like chemotaxis protein